MRYRFLDFELDTERHELRRLHDGWNVAVPLQPRTYKLLTILIEKRPAAVSQQDIYDQLWPDTFVDRAAIHNLAHQLRDALGDDGRECIRTVYGFGFAFAAPVTVTAGGSRIARCRLRVDGKIYVLAEGENVVGRDVDAGVRLDMPSVSRHHARIVVSADGVEVSDLGSKNGTSVRGTAISAPTFVTTGDELSFGNVSAIIEIEPPAGTTQTVT